MTLGIATIRILTNRLPDDGYSAYILLANLVPWFSLADIGMGSCLQNEVSAASARGESDETIVAAAVMVTCIGTGTLLISSVALSSSLGAAYLGRFTDDGYRHFAIGASLATCICIGMFAQRIWYARQVGHYASVASIVGSSGGAIGLLLLPANPDLSVAIVAGMGPQAAVGIGTLALLLPKDASQYRRALSDGTLRTLFRKSREFFALGLTSTLVFNLDYIVASRFLSGSETVAYSICARIFDTFNVLYSAVLLAYWPRAAQDLTLGMKGAVERTTRRYAGLGIAAVFAAGGLFFVGKELVIRILAPSSEVIFPVALVVAMTLLAAVRVWTNTASIVVHALGRVRVITLLIPVQAVINIALMASLVPRFGSAGMPMATFLSYVCTTAWALPLYVRRHVS